MSKTNADRFEEIKKKRNWISDKLIHYVDIVFGLVVGQSIIRNLDLILNPLKYFFAFLALIVIISTVTLSWIGYHKSMYNYPYKVETISIRRIRPFTDFIIVVFYTLLLFTVDNFKTDPANINLTSFILFYVLIFFLYLVDGLLRIIEYRDRDASKWLLLLRYFIYYSLLSALYIFLYCRLQYMNIINYSVLIICLVLTLRFRFLRERGYKPDLNLTLVVDVDGVLADQVTPVLENINDKYGSKYTKEYIRRWDQPLPIANTDIKTEIENSHHHPGYVLKMKPMPDAKNVLRELSKYCGITIATNRTRVANISTYLWLIKNNIPYDKYVNTSIKGKGAAKGNILIDDYPKNVLEFTANEGEERTAFIFTQPWNENDQSLIGNDKIVRVNNWQEVLEKILSMKYIPAQKFH